MTFGIRWTETALQRIEEIGDHIAATNPSAAVRMVDRLFERVETAAEHPLLAPRYRWADDPTIRCLLAKPYLVIYRVHEPDEVIAVLTIRHARQLPQAGDEP